MPPQPVVAGLYCGFKSRHDWCASVNVLLFSTLAVHEMLIIFGTDIFRSLNITNGIMMSKSSENRYASGNTEGVSAEVIKKNICCYNNGNVPKSGVVVWSAFKPFLLLYSHSR